MIIVRMRDSVPWEFGISKKKRLRQAEAAPSIRQRSLDCGGMTRLIFLPTVPKGKRSGKPTGQSSDDHESFLSTFLALLRFFDMGCIQRTPPDHATTRPDGAMHLAKEQGLGSSLRIRRPMRCTTRR